MTQQLSDSICINEMVYGSIHFIFNNDDVLHKRKEHKETLNKFERNVDDKIKSLLNVHSGVSIDESYFCQDFGFGFKSVQENKQNLINFLNDLKSFIGKYDFINWYLE